MDFAEMKRSEVIDWANKIINNYQDRYQDETLSYENMVGNDKDFRDVMERERGIVESIFSDDMTPLVLLDQERILENHDEEGKIAEMKKRKYIYALPYAYPNTLTPAPILCELEITGQERRLDDVNTPSSMKNAAKGTIKIKSEWNCLTDKKGESWNNDWLEYKLASEGYCTISDGNRSQLIECQSLLY